MSRRIRWGVIGSGKIAHTFANALQASHTGLLCAVASRSLDKARAFAAEFAVELAFGSYEELLASADVDAVYIATPHPSHARWCVLAARAKKHILVEKPLGMNAAEVMAACTAARENDVFLMEAFMYRCHPQTERLLELLRSGVIGRVRSIAASFGFDAPFDPHSRLYDPELGGGAILDVGCYPVSFARLVAAAALGLESVEPDVLKGTGVLNQQTGVDEVACAVLRFPGDILAQVSTGIALTLDNVARIYGSKGSLELTKPWAPARHGGESEIVVRRGDSEERVRVQAELPLATYEIERVATELERRQASFPAMGWNDSLANARTLDRWLEEIGLRYPGESLERPVQTVSGLPLSRRDGSDGSDGSAPQR